LENSTVADKYAAGNTLVGLYTVTSNYRWRRVNEWMDGPNVHLCRPAV